MELNIRKRHSLLDGLVLYEPIDINILDKCINSRLLKTNYQDEKWFKNDKQLEYPKQFHFNTFKLNDYLSKICKERNIEIIDDEFYAFELSLFDIDLDGDLDILLASKDLFGSHFGTLPDK